MIRSHSFLKITVSPKETVKLIKKQKSTVLVLEREDANIATLKF